MKTQVVLATRSVTVTGVMRYLWFTAFVCLLTASTVWPGVGVVSHANPRLRQEESHTPFDPGDVFVGVAGGQVKRFDRSGNLVDTLVLGPRGDVTAGMAFDRAGNLYVTGWVDNRVVKFSNRGERIGTFGNGYDRGPESVTFDAAGNLYIGQADGTHDILKFAETGDLLARFSPATEDRGSDWVDLAADQCTLYYTSEGTHVKRFDVCTNKQLPDFATLPAGKAYSLRIRPNGEVIVATKQEPAIVYRLDTTGDTIQSYTPHYRPDLEREFEWSEEFLYSVVLDPDGTSFWTASPDGRVYRYDIISGELVTSFDAGYILTYGYIPPIGGGLAVFGEIVAAVPSPTVTQHPEAEIPEVVMPPAEDEPSMAPPETTDVTDEDIH
jgi:sugar lactone lactonase YvrE